MYFVTELTSDIFSYYTHDGDVYFWELNYQNFWEITFWIFFTEWCWYCQSPFSNIDVSSPVRVKKSNDSVKFPQIKTDVFVNFV
jgi:hypothetical protein